MEDGVVERWLTVEDLFSKKVSYAQNQEDILLDRVFAKRSGFYVDVGANDPVFHSVTKFFYDLGWHGINIEPNPALHARLVCARERDVNLNFGVSNAEGILTFYDVPEFHGWSSFEVAFANSYRAQGVEVLERPIAVTTLSTICEQHVHEQIDFLKIDVEGFERLVLEGFDLRRWRPRVIVMEATWPQTWEHLILATDYRFALFDGLNRFYVRAEDAELIEPLSTPVSVLDGFVPYEYVRILESTGAAPDLSPTTIGLVRRIKRVTSRHPRLTSMVKRLLRLAG
jgi:FkbM family methyltransferase